MAASLLSYSQYAIYAGQSHNATTGYAAVWKNGHTARVVQVREILDHSVLFHNPAFFPHFLGNTGVIEERFSRRLMHGGQYLWLGCCASADG